jgi:hypothetical protein
MKRVVNVTANLVLKMQLLPLQIHRDKQLVKKLEAVAGRLLN